MQVLHVCIAPMPGACSAHRKHSGNNPAESQKPRVTLSTWTANSHSVHTSQLGHGPGEIQGQAWSKAEALPEALP